MTPPEPSYSVVARPAQRVVGVTRTVTRHTLGEVADEIPGVLRCLAERAVEPAGAPFLRYLRVGATADWLVQAGVPVEEAPAPDDLLRPDVLPGGRYATTTHVGPYDGLERTTAGLLRWAEREGLRFDARPSEQGQLWASRVEWYETNPAEQLDPARWVTRLTFKLAD